MCRMPAPFSHDRSTSPNCFISSIRKCWVSDCVYWLSSVFLCWCPPLWHFCGFNCFQCNACVVLLPSVGMLLTRSILFLCLIGHVQAKERLVDRCWRLLMRLPTTPHIRTALRDLNLQPASSPSDFADAASGAAAATSASLAAGAPSSLVSTQASTAAWSQLVAAHNIYKLHYELMIVESFLCTPVPEYIPFHRVCLLSFACSCRTACSVAGRRQVPIHCNIGC